MSDWLNYDRDDPGYHIMSDDKIVNNLRSEEVTADNGITLMTMRKNVPSQSDAFQALGLAIAWMEWQEE